MYTAVHFNLILKKPRLSTRFLGAIGLNNRFGKTGEIPDDIPFFLFTYLQYPFFFLLSDTYRETSEKPRGVERRSNDR